MRGGLRFLMSVAVCASAGWPQPLPPASEFYVVSVGFSDALPGWHRSVLEVRPDGFDLLVRYIRVMPSSAYCGEATKILATATRLPAAALPEITDGVNLCTIDSQELSRTVRALPPPRGMTVFAGDQFAIVAKCGTDTRVIPVPGDWKVDMERLKRKRPRVAALWRLEETVGTRAFDAFPSLDTVPSAMAARLQPATEAMLAVMQSGRFDAGLAAIARRSFKDDVAALRPESDAPEFSVRLADADHFRFDRFAEPSYPPLAKQARMSGTVELDLMSNSATGEVLQATVVSGNPLLAQAAQESARQWRFEPSPETASHAIRVVLEFAFHCP